MKKPFRRAGAVKRARRPRPERERRVGSPPVNGPIEREFKLRLPGEEALAALLARLLELGGVAAAPVRQVNHFFDSASHDLRRARLALRLREEAAAFVVTLKGPELGAPGVLSSRAEEELAIDAATARAILESRLDPLAALAEGPRGETPLVRKARGLVAGAPLERLGGFENERLRVGPLRLPGAGSSGPLVFELDRTRFPGGRVERELEVEVPFEAATEEVERALRDLLDRLGIGFRPAPSKAARLFRILDGTASGD